MAWANVGKTKRQGSIQKRFGATLAAFLLADSGLTLALSRALPAWLGIPSDAI